MALQPLFIRGWKQLSAYHPLVADGCNALMKVSNKLYNEISSNCPLKLWKDRLTAVWGDETR